MMARTPAPTGYSRSAAAGSRRLPMSIAIALALTVLTVAIPMARGLDDFVVTVFFSIAIFSLYLVMTAVVTDRRYGLFVLLFCFYHLYFLILPGMLHIARGYFPFYGMTYPDDDIRTGALIVAIFCIAYAVGFFYFMRKAGTSQVTIAVERHIYSRRRFAIYAILLLGITLTIVWLNGLEMFTVRRLDGELQFDSRQVASQIVFNFGRLPAFVSFCIFIALVRQAPRPVYFVGLLISFAIFIVVNSPAAIPRYYLFGYLFAVLFILFDFRPMYRKVGFVMGLIFGLLIIFPLINFLGRGSDRDILTFDPIEYYAESGDYDGFQSVLNIVDLVNDKGPSFGYQVIGVPLAIIPREIWTDKPVATGELAARHMGYEFTNISSPLASEIFIDWWWGGIVLLGPLIGYLSARLDMVSIRRRQQADLWHPLIFALAVGFETIVLRGSLMGASTPIGLAVVLMLAPGLFGKKGVWRPPAAGHPRAGPGRPAAARPNRPRARPLPQARNRR